MLNTSSEQNKRHIKTRLDEVQNILINNLREETSKETNQENLRAIRKILDEVFQNYSIENEQNLQDVKAIIDHAEAKILSSDGEQLLENKRYEEAIGKFQEALKYRNKNGYHNNIAECFFMLGKRAFDAKEFKGAKEFYKKAIEECIGDYQGIKKFEDALNAIKDEEAERLNAEGLLELQGENFEVAKEKIARALKTCNLNYIKKNTFEENMTKVEDAENLLKALEKIPKLRGEKAIETLTEVLDKVQNFDNIKEERINEILQFLYKHNAMDEAREFIKKNPESRQEILKRNHKEKQEENMNKKRMELNFPNKHINRNERKIKTNIRH